MVIQELKKAIIDTLEFLIPPFIKLGIALVILQYISYGVLLDSISFSISDNLDIVKLEKIKSLIDNLYLSSIVPIIVILLLISLAYLIDRITEFIGSLVPLSVKTSATIQKEFFLEIWKYFPEIKEIYELILKIDQLFTLAKSSNFSQQFDFVSYNEEKRNKLFRNLSFINFLLIWSITSFFIIRANIDYTLLSNRLIYILFFLFLIMIAIYFMIAMKEFDIQKERLMVVINFLIINKEYIKNESQEHLIEIEKNLSYSKKWWSIKIGYSFDWLTMYKYFKPPFYWKYQVWKNKKHFKNK